MIRRPDGFGAFQFATLAGLRATQLARGCAPRVIGGHNTASIAQMEVAAGKIEAAVTTVIVTPDRRL